MIDSQYHPRDNSIPERVEGEPNLEDHGMAHFQEAIDLAASMSDAELTNNFLRIARCMWEAGVQPRSALERLIEARDNAERDKDFYNIGVTEIHAMLGEVDEMEALHDATRGGISFEARRKAVLEIASRGEDPTPLISSELARIQSFTEKTTRNIHTARGYGYARLASLCIELEHSPEEYFSIAETELSEAAKEPLTRIIHRDTFNELIRIYAANGRYEDAERQIEYYPKDSREFGTKKTLKIILQEQTRRKDFDAAALTAERVGENAELTYAKKALYVATQGGDPTGDISKAYEHLADNQGIYYFGELESLYPIIGAALVRCGRLEEGIALFQQTREEMKELHDDDPLMPSYEEMDISVKLAEAIDDAGLDATEAFCEALEYINEAVQIEDATFGKAIAGIAPDVLEHTINQLSLRGYFDIAAERIDKWPLDQNDKWTKRTRCDLLAELAKAEILWEKRFNNYQ